MLKKLFKEEKGFTMIELIIVIAIIAIISAIIAPNFNQTTAKAKVKADIASIREINRQIALYAAESGSYPAGNESIKHDGTTSNSSGGLSTLKAKNYLDHLPVPQTQGLTFSYDATTGRAFIGKDGTPSQHVIDAINGLSSEEREFINSTDFSIPHS